MDIWDIIYDLVKEYRAAKKDEVKRKELAVSLCRKAYFRFNSDWESEINSERIENIHRGQQEILSKYSQVFLEIATEILDTLPEESEKMVELAAKMKKGAYSDVTHDSPNIIPEGVECANEAVERFKLLGK